VVCRRSNFRSTRAQPDVDAINAAEEVKFIFSAGDGEDRLREAAGISEDNILFRWTVNLPGAPANRGLL
jgi:hypothetical protein